MTAPATLALAPTPARAALCAAVEATIAKAHARGLEPKAIYLTDAWLNLCCLTINAGDPPRCYGLPIHRITGSNRPVVYTKYGLALGLTVALKTALAEAAS